MPSFFDYEAEFQVHRRNLPHWAQSAVTYFVTSHLADSLPVKKLAEFKTERKRWLEVNPPPHSEQQIQEYRRNFSQRMQKWLDAGYGSCILARPAIFRMVESALKFFNGHRYLLGEYIVMPNHVHGTIDSASCCPQRLAGQLVQSSIGVSPVCSRVPAQSSEGRLSASQF